MKHLLAALVLSLFCLTPANAVDLTKRFDDGVTVTLHGDAPCSDEKVLAMIKPEFRHTFFAGTVQYSDRTIGLCWKLYPELGVLGIVDAEENVGEFPMSLFSAVSL
jgi:hypothetical protein